MSEFALVAGLLFLVGVGLIVAYTSPWRSFCAANASVGWTNANTAAAMVQ